MTNERFPTREEVASRIQTREVILMPDNSLIEIDNLEPQKRKETLVQSNLNIGEENVIGEKRLSTELTRKMIELEWLDYEKASGKGHFRYYPKGALIHSTLENMIRNYAQDNLSATPVLTPQIFNWDDEQITKEAGTFSRNLYHVIPGATSKAPEQVLRFGGDFGIFKLMQNAELTEAQLPIRIYEAGVVFRSSKTGEQSNIQRAESFFLPAIYSFCKNDIIAGIEEFTYLHNKFSQFLNNLGLEYSHNFEINNTFFNEHRDEIVSILRYDNKPALIRLASSKRHYYQMKSRHVVGNEFKSFDIQLDDENAKTYGIRYSNTINDKQNNAPPCIIVQSSLATIQRWMLIFLNDALKKDPQELPLWLAPVQIRIIPLDEKYMSFVVEVAQRLNSLGIRVDVDDRRGKINQKIRKANNDLIPFTILWGRTEESTQTASLRARDGSLISCALDELATLIKTKVNSYGLNLDYHPHLPITVSATPIFRSMRV
jgi:threonyl-tRNA synthetase